MANSESSAEAVVPVPAVKVPMMPLLLGVVAAALLSVGGAGGVVYLLAKSGRLHLGGGGGGGEAVAKKVVEAPTHPMAMEPMLANLSDPDGHAYLRLGVVLQVEDEEKKVKEEKKDAKAPSAADAQLRDTVLEVLGRTKSADLLMPDGKERLKKQLKEKFVEENTSVKVHEVYFTDFLVQR